MEAIILVGGLGTRLGELTRNTPKPMLPIRGIPFLERLLLFLKSHNFSRIILAVGYKKKVVESYFSVLDQSLPEIVYSVEDSPLGTGGAIAQALTMVKSEHVFVLNGDSYLDVDFDSMLSFHKDKDSDVTIASYFIKPADRYGVMQVNNKGEVIYFEEKGMHAEGLINGGVYLLKAARLRDAFEREGKDVFSFEESVLSNISLGLKKYHIQTNGHFLDIGVPTDYERSQKELFL